MDFVAMDFVAIATDHKQVVNIAIFSRPDQKLTVAVACSKHAVTIHMVQGGR